MYYSTFLSYAALASCASAHMIMQSPKPYNPAPDNSPLSADGSNFPCKKASGAAFTVNSATTAASGSKVSMTFTGSAVHNGGSCQVSLTKDGASSVSATSSFKVIYSILGGCPGLNGQPTAYDVPIPSEVPAGDYTYAWTWYNNVGNREIYMNCAPISITGGSGTDDAFNSLPDMAVYNLQGAGATQAKTAGCKTVESFDVDFPNPGKYVLKGASFKPNPPVCNGQAAVGGSGGAGTGSAGSGSGSGAAPSTANGGGASPTQSFNDGLYHPSSAASPSTLVASASPSAAVPSASPQVAAPSAAAPSASAPAAPAAPAASNGSSVATPAAPATPGSSGTVSGTACSPNGAMVCSPDGTKFGLCNWGTVQFMPVAAGTSCSNGLIMKRRARRDVVRKAMLFEA